MISSYGHTMKSSYREIIQEINECWKEKFESSCLKRWFLTIAPHSFIFKKRNNHTQWVYDNWGTIKIKLREFF
jgi:hypothetical protein